MAAAEPSIDGRAARLLPIPHTARVPIGGPVLGRTIGRFRVVAPLGRGGMATVWKAQDELLGRHVALKILSESQLGSQRMRRRFLQEARLAGALDHPGIAAVYDAGDCEGQIYIAFALVDGETVSQRIARGPLEVGECVRIAIAAAEALGHAHARGVVHRDVSSRNIMVAQDGRVYVLDFGLARIRGAARITDSQDMLGTLPYLAPEVVRGRRAGASADVYGLGVVLYEALTGAPPFGDRQPAALLYAIINTPPPAPRARRSEITPALEVLLLRALSKDPRRRPRQGRAFAEELAGLDVVTGWKPSGSLPVRLRADDDEAWRSGPPRTIQVLPFEDLGEGEEVPERRRLLARGLAANLSASLARLPGLQVITPWQLPGDRGGPSDSGDLVLRGTVRRAGAGLRVTFSILEGKSGVQVAGDALDGSIAMPFDLEDRLTASVAGALGQQADLPAATRRTPRDPAAHEHYLQALGYLQRYHNEASVDGAIRLLEALLASEGDSASVQAALGRAYLHKYRLTFEPRWESLAATACERALGEDPRAADVLLTLGEVHAAVGRHAEAISVFQQALELRPDSVDAWLGLSVALGMVGQFQDAEQAARHAIAARPGGWSGHNRIGVLCFKQGRFEEAVEAWNEVVRLSPDNARGLFNLGAAYYHLDRLEEAVAALRHSIVVEPTGSAFVSLGTALFGLGRRSEALRAFESATALRPADPVTWGNLGNACRWIPGEEARAAEALDRAVTLMHDRLEQKPMDEEGWARLAGWLENRGRSQEAAEALSRWRAIGPREARSMAWAGVTYLGLEHRNEGIHWLREALRLGYSLKALRREPALQELRDDPEVSAILKLELASKTQNSTPSPD